ncbi:MAG: branched-chain amino acid aminotransferase, partial [Thermoproteota archaeon]
VSEKSITPTNLFTADEAFFTGTAVEVVPLIEVNKRKIGNGKPGPITLNLMQEFRKLVRNPEAGVAIYQ